MKIGQLDKRRYEALAGYTRDPAITLITEELDWFADRNERVLGLLVFDLIDHDFGWVVFGRDALSRFRAINVGTSHRTAPDAYNALMGAMLEATAQPDESFFQGDEQGSPVDFFSPVVDEARFHPSFRLLLTDPLHSSAREIISAMMRYHKDVDGNFVQKFQTDGWDSLIWELYLFATFTELGFSRDTTEATPDFVLRSHRGNFSVEATSINPSRSDSVSPPRTREQFVEYLENYIPIRISSALRSKLNHKPPYWEQQSAKGLPFCIAVQDFHYSGTMRFITPAATEFVFGVRHSLEGGQRKIKRIGVHRYRKRRAQSGFFELDGAENVSAVIVNPQGTIAKFNRLGLAAGFGNPKVRMTRTGYQRNERNARSPLPSRFTDEAGPLTKETWVEGMVVLHNPKARIPLDPVLLPGAAHEFLQPDGSIMSLLPDFHPLFSETHLALCEP